MSYYNPALEDKWRAGLDGRYCGMCGNCTGICPNGVAFKDIIRFRMYNNDYKLPEFARTEYASLGKGCTADNCRDCGLCESVCSRHLPVRRMIREAHATFA